MWLGYGTQRMHTEFWWRNLLENIHLEDREGDKEVTGLNGGKLWGWEVDGTDFEIVSNDKLWY